MDKIEQFQPLFALDNVGGGQVGTSNYDRALRTATSTMRAFYMYFFNLVTNIFEWKNLPKSMDATYIEDMLALTGKVAFVNDKDFGLMSPQFTASKIDWYGRPAQIECFANDYQRTFNNTDDFIIVRNTNNFVPTFQYIDYFVQKIVAIQDVVDINLNAMKTPVVFKGTREQRSYLQELFKKYDGNAWYLFLEKDASGNVESMNTQAPYLVDKLNEQIRFLTDMFLTFIGLDNTGGTYKRERSLVDEINANNELIGLTCESMLRQREMACEEFNEKFKDILEQPISVGYSDEVKKSQATAEEDAVVDESAGDENE